MQNDVTVILNGYKRPHTFPEQLVAIHKQTLLPKNVMYWQNTMPDITYDAPSINRCVSVLSNVNFGVWSRFYYALNAKTNYICIFDDDTIPGSQWLENCVQTYQNFPGLLGTIGVLFQNKTYWVKERIGWDGPNEETREVDIVGHAWFFHRDLLPIFCRELPPLDHNMIVGEDIHFSWMLQKYTNYKTYVPPHPRGNMEMWGSRKGWEYGGDRNATAGTAIPLMQDYMKLYTDAGFKMLYEREG